MSLPPCPLCDYPAYTEQSVGIMTRCTNCPLASRFQGSFQSSEAAWIRICGQINNIHFKPKIEQSKDSDDFWSDV